MQDKNSKLRSKLTQSCELGKSVNYDSQYNPKRLFSIPRDEQRARIGVDSLNLPFYGFDVWNHYEVSWLNRKGKPMVATAVINYDCTSKSMVESKSLKLYFNSLNNTVFENTEMVQKTIKTDLESLLDTNVNVTLYSLHLAPQRNLSCEFDGLNIDDLDIACRDYQVNPESLITIGDDIVSEVLVSDLLKSNCLVTNQPDWGSLQISYTGKAINHAGLLQYIISFRNHDEFHEQCVERIFIDIMRRCSPERLTVYGRYTRRGGIDINAFRSSEPVTYSDQNIRLVRQ